MLITEAYAQQNQEMHERYADYGSKGLQWAAYVEQLVIEDGHRTVLDYGAGKGSLRRTLARAEIEVAEYDPGIPGKDQPPEPADLVVCLDVLEHVEPDLLDNVLSDLARLTKRKLFFDICIIPAQKTLTDGRNAHLLIHSAEWWKEQLSRVFDLVYVTERQAFICGEAVPKGMAYVKSKRRRMTPEVSAFCEMVRVQMDAHSDAMSKIDTISMWEGVDDRAADLQIVADNLDGPEDPRPKIIDAIRLTRKVMLARVLLTEERPEEFWKPIFERHLRIGNWQVDDDKLVCIGTPKVGVEGVKVVGARPSDERWEQAKANCARIAKRVPQQAVHERKAILACYGPSIKQTIPLLKEQAAAGDADVISVSGSHDFLLSHGVVPTYHVECDPRAHKADNIDAAHPSVRYLIGSAVHPALLDKLEGADVALWHIATSEHINKFLQELKEPGNMLVTGGGSVGLRAISLLYNMGYREFHIYGMDCSFADDGNEQWAGKHAGKRQEAVKIATVAGEIYWTSLVLVSYATEFIEMIQRMSTPAPDIRLYGHGLLQSMVAMHAQMGEKIRDGELPGTIERPNGMLFPITDTQWNNIGGQSADALSMALEHTTGRGIVVQAGGNVGILANALAQHFAHVYTFEPDADNFACLDHNVVAKNVTKRQAALGASSASGVSLEKMPNNCGSHNINGVGSIPVATIDELDLPSCDLIVLDVEGYELFALRGAEQTIAIFRPTVVLEDKGLSKRYGIAEGDAPGWLMENFGYKVVQHTNRDIVLRPA